MHIHADHFGDRYLKYPDPSDQYYPVKSVFRPQIILIKSIFVPS